ncbi:hypothetical protein H2199_009286 [Coniosporium tulheliwenetii]|uniref:Uncharacterized protein n=1 Tax=Coniosporium tulheliwenetii TaxID=3383036 RepID=A0ACC2YET4_9PEZI|nr:hypothetical protein H2199_009286 [Cladosporium sp. JES 115]
MLGSELTERQLDALRMVWDDDCWDRLEREEMGPTRLEENGEEKEDVDESDDESDDESEIESERESDSSCAIERQCPKDGLELLHPVTPETSSDSSGKVKGGSNKAPVSMRDRDDRLSELVFRLSVRFATEEFTDGQPRSSLLVYFSGVLGFSECNQTFRRAKDFTSCLSGLIYLLRLIFLEYALPYRSYNHIGLEQRPSREHLARLDQVRLRYMISGCLTPLAEFQDLRDFGRTLSRSDPPSFMVHWSDDGTTMRYHNTFMTITQFKEFTHRLLASAEALVQKLMYDWLPEVDLGKLKDELCNTRRGFSFVSHPENGLTNAFLQLSTRACMDRADGLLSDNQWNRAAVFRYLRRKEVLLESLLAVMYVLAGQGPRSTELLSLQHCNGPFGERGVYIHNGYMIYIARHHKARRSTNKEFYVVRFLPWAAGRLLFYYLVYIRPFTEMLKRQVPIASSEAGSSMLFSSDHAPEQPWSSHRLTAILKKSSLGLFEKPIGVRLNRQLSIAITEKHIKSIATPFNIYDDKSPDADIDVIFAWQSCHRPLQRATTYGLDGAFPTKLQPALLRRYEYASVKWHRFLEHESKGDILSQKR